MRELISSFERRFEDLHLRRAELIRKTGEAELYLRPPEAEPSMLPFSVGEFVVRSAAAVEQMAGGITTRLWDDPFEWTLPERMPTPQRVLDYLLEVEESRRRAFVIFKDDDELKKTIPAPVELRTLHDILLEALTNSERFYGQALATHQTASKRKSA